MPDINQNDVAYHRARFATRCMVCANPISRGSLIVTLVDNDRIKSEKKTKARWAHPSCLTEALRASKILTTASARRAWKRRSNKRARRASLEPRL